MIEVCLFTIHYGEIKTYPAQLQTYMLYLFTIHYGEIKTCCKLAMGSD